MEGAQDNSTASPRVGGKLLGKGPSLPTLRRGSGQIPEPCAFTASLLGCTGDVSTSLERLAASGSGLSGTFLMESFPHRQEMVLRHC